jgi:hypothetical protein
MADIALPFVSDIIHNMARARCETGYAEKNSPQPNAKLKNSRYF